MNHFQPAFCSRARLKCWTLWSVGQNSKIWTLNRLWPGQTDLNIPFSEHFPVSSNLCYAIIFTSESFRSKPCCIDMLLFHRKESSITVISPARTHPTVMKKKVRKNECVLEGGKKMWTWHFMIETCSRVDFPCMYASLCVLTLMWIVLFSFCKLLLTNLWRRSDFISESQTWKVWPVQE